MDLSSSIIIGILIFLLVIFFIAFLKTKMMYFTSMDYSVMNIRDVKIPAGDVELAGKLLLPKFVLGEKDQLKEKLPVIIMNPGWGSPMDLPIFKAWASSFALGGPFAVLLYDIRGQGKSPGKHIIGEKMFEDVTKVIDFAEKVPEIDPQRIGFWGLSLGGEMALAKAYPDERIKAVIGVCALNNYKTNFTRPIHSIQQKLIRFFMHTSGVKPEKVSDEINKIISPEFNLDSERDYLNARTMLMICTDDPIIGFSEFEKNRKTMKLADDHVLICSKGGHTFGGQELTVTATTLRFFKSIL